MKRINFRDPSQIIGWINTLLLFAILFAVIRLLDRSSAIYSGGDGGDLPHSAELNASAESEVSDLDVHTRADAEELVGRLGSSPNAVELSDALDTIDKWMGVGDEQVAIDEYKLQEVGHLRTLIAHDVTDLHESALKAENGHMASDLFGRAGRLLAKYPMDTSKQALDEAARLSAQHGEVGTRIEVIRRQRYNIWALRKIEETIAAINSNASSFKTSDNPLTIDATIEHLGEIDPLLLEPIAIGLYNYAIEQAKSSINSEQQLELAKRLVDPQIKRKILGDF